MRATIASGKGGTGKTTVTASLAAIWPAPLTAVDLDVEEPNLHLFLNPELSPAIPAYMDVPEVVEDACTQCGACSDLCQFKAITQLGDYLMVFREMCHGCGGCFAVCPADALRHDRRELGEVIPGTCSLGDGTGSTKDIKYLMGKLRVGEAMSPPLMRQVKQYLDAESVYAGRDVLFDAPPGVSCPAVNAVMDSDVIVLVTEPTPFGLYDFKLAWEAFAPLGKPMGAVVNRAGSGDDGVERFCAEKDIPIWASIPFDRQVAQAYSNGRIISEAVAPLRPIFEGLCARMMQAAEATGRSASSTDGPGAPAAEGEKQHIGGQANV